MADEQLHVLLIDDEPHLLLGLSALMKREGFHVSTAPNGNKGLEVIQQGGIDLIVCDIMMPPPNGMQLKEQLAQHPEMSKIPFIFLTARTTMGDKVAGLNLGADDYITKPFKVEELVARVKSVWRRHQVGRQQGLAEAEETIDQLRRFLKMTAQLVAEDGELVELSASDTQPADDSALAPVSRDTFRQRLDELDDPEIYPVGLVIFKIMNLDPQDQGRLQLRGVAQCLHQAFASRQWIFQLDSDEFIVLLPRFVKAEIINQLIDVRSKLARFNQEHAAQALQLRLGMTVGKQGTPLSDVMQEAEGRMTDLALTP